MFRPEFHDLVDLMNAKANEYRQYHASQPAET